MEHHVTLRLLKEKYSVCKVDKKQAVPKWIESEKWYTVTKTEDELSIVCRECVVPEDITCEKDWKCFKVEGVLDFNLVGILSFLSTMLAKASISLFVISTYNTDYILVKNKDVEKAKKTFKENGVTVNL